MRCLLLLVVVFFIAGCATTKKRTTPAQIEEAEVQFDVAALYSEATMNLSGIKLSEEGYRLAKGTYINCATSPRVTPDQNAVQWVDTGGGFTTIDFMVAANVRFVYAVNQATETSFVAEALGDTDGDGNRILIVATESTSPHIIGSQPGDARLTLTLGTANDTKD
jgi:hypothetical protein